MSTRTPGTVTHGDGIGSKIMAASLHNVAWPSLDTKKLATTAGKANGDRLKLTMFDNRGMKVWPEGMSETLLGRVLDQGIENVKTETLGTCNGNGGYSLSQGQ